MIDHDDLIGGLTELDEGATGIEIEDTESEGRILEPFDPKLIRVAAQTSTISLLLSRIEHNELELRPEFQRKVVWKDDAQSRLIESLLIRIPLPAFYLDGTDEDKWLVVDGLQRLTALKGFVQDQDLRLTGLEFLTQYNGQTFDNLPRGLQRRIYETQVTVYLIEQGTPDKVKFNIFKRINTGGLPLSAQEIRHALYQGVATKLLEELADSEEFKRATDYSIRDKRMGDREIILRFLAFAMTPHTEYTDDLDDFLNEAMQRINAMGEHEVNKLRTRFVRAMNAAWEVFNSDAFRKRYKPDARRAPINKALFESWAVNLDNLDDPGIQKLVRRRERLMDGFMRLMNDPDFDRAIS